MKHFDLHDLISTAISRTGYSDLGEPDFMENMEVFIRAVNEGQGISEDRWQQCREYYIRLLMNRIWFAKDLKENPDILEEKLRPPVVILPQPRTGSTKLHRMLASGGSFQDVLWWHMHMMSRIPNEPEGGKIRRIQEAKDFEEWSLNASPNLANGHPLYALITEEEQLYHEMTFWSFRMALQSSTPPWHHQWLAENGAEQAYDFLYKQLQYTQWQHYPKGEKPFLLKSPTNVGQEHHLTRLFGSEMKVISTHRDPVNVVCSIGEVANHYREIFSDQAMTKEQEHYYGQTMLLGFSQAAKANLAWRDAHPEIEVLDLSFNDINSNPQKVLTEVYQHIDIPLTDEVKANIISWEQDSSRNKFKKNNYSLERFGLTHEQVYEAYAPYIERFGDHMELG